jgi:hypothetical protein
MMSKVFVVNKGCHDYSPAQEYGELVYLSHSSMDRFDLSKIWRKFEPQLINSHSDDWILVSGLTIMSVVATGIFVQLHNKLNILLYKSNKKGASYIGETVILGGSNDTLAKHSSANNRDMLRDNFFSKKARVK